LATATDQIRLATGILILPQRNPIYTAKQLATLDWLSGGRVDVGIGLGWNRLEFAALAVPWARRGDRCDEYVDLIRTLWRDDPAEHHGEFWELASCHQFPKPAQKPGPPLWFGGTSDRALARVATRGDGWYLFDPRPDSLARRLIVLDELLIAAGRTRRDVTVVVGTGFPHPTLREVEGYAEAGASQVVVSLSGAAPDAMRAELQALAEDLAIGRGPAMSGT
jgi:probable F420-dependent oxidoreductase